MIFDPQTQEMTVLERLKIRVIVSGEVHRSGAQEEDEVGRVTARGGKRGKQTAVRKCKKCGQAGHRRDHCPDNINAV